MSLLFHPSLGRFTHPDEAHASGTDSDSYYGHSQRRVVHDHRSRREVDVGQPGSRRHQRHMNDTLANYESEYDTASDFDSEEDRPIVRFEWQGKFVQAGTDFFTERIADAPMRERRSDKLARRMPKMTRRLRGSAPVEEQVDEESESHAHARRVRAAKFAAHGALAASSAPAVAASAASTSATDSEAESAATAAAPSASSLDRISEQQKRARRRGVAGQEAAGALFLQVDHTMRHALRKSSEHEHLFLTELEALMIDFKNGRLHRRGRKYSGASSHATAAVPRTFDLLQSERSPVAAGDDDTEATSDDDGLVVVSTGSRRAAVGADDAPVQVSFRSARERFLAHGLAQFHQLVCESHDAEASSSKFAVTAAAGQRCTQIRIPRAGVRLHQARLVPYLAKLAAQGQGRSLVQ